MVAGAVLVHVFVIHFFAAQGRRAVEGFEDGHAVRASAADVIDFAATRFFIERVDETRHVERVDVVTNLFAFIAENFVELTFDVAFDEVAQKAVQFHAAVIGAGQTAAAQTAGLHAEVTPVFLHHHVTGDFGRAENAVLALVNGKFLGDAVGVSGVVVIPARGEFLETNRVGAVAINFVGAHVREHDFGHVTARGFEQIQRADGVHVKIIERARGGEIVARLRGGVNEQCWFQRGNQFVRARAVADVEFVMLKIFVGGKQTALIPARVAARAKKVGAHVVVHAVNFPAELAEMGDDFRTDETGRAGDEQFVHNSTADFVPVNSQVLFGIGESTGRWITLCIFIPKGNRVVQLPVAAGRQLF